MDHTSLTRPVLTPPAMGALMSLLAKARAIFAESPVAEI